MAEGILRSRLAAAGLAGQVTVGSAGTLALVSSPASALGDTLLAEQGIDISAHRAQLITRPLLDRADLILVMTEDHRRSIFYYDARYLPKVLLLSELSGTHTDIPDPYGQDRKVYAAVYTTICQLIDRGWESLLQRLQIVL